MHIICYWIWAAAPRVLVTGYWVLVLGVDFAGFGHCSAACALCACIFSLTLASFVLLLLSYISRLAGPHHYTHIRTSECVCVCVWQDTLHVQSSFMACQCGNGSCSCLDPKRPRPRPIKYVLSQGIIFGSTAPGTTLKYLSASKAA